ncbi:nuclear transport factor 2 family protein [Hymenobacter sp. BT175]|uniref:YybH family protein n=1 Tax=Hymenobacter translucens TaxID=2886507 RepID=UPI001D0E9A45|nr:nuclear transport factor 2 family protein [Hymenobacter translucens]MCC2544925.1 nuclear transport factor 2 family protein [Hymenobacter translucens]
MKSKLSPLTWSRRGLLAALLSLGLLSACTGNEPPTTLRTGVARVLATQTAAWNRGDAAGFMAGYWKSDSLVFIGKNGLTYGWQRTLDNYRRSYPDAAAMGQLTFTSLRITPIGSDAAHVVGKWHLARPAAGNLQGHFLLVFRRIEGRWVIVADHSS